MRHLLLAVLLAAPLPAAAQGPARDLPYRTFGNWLVGCDNAGGCAALVLPEGEGPGRVYLRIARGGAGADAAEMSVVPVGGGAPPAGWRIAIENGATVGPVVPRANDLTGRSVLSPREFNALLPGLRDGARLTVEGGNRPPFAMDIRGGGAALRWMDERQGRSRTTTALVARGPGAPPTGDGAPPKVGIPPTVPQTNLPRAPALNTAGADTACEAPGTGAPPGSAGRLAGPTVAPPPPASVRLAGGNLLHLLPCARTAQGPTFLPMLTNREGRSPRKISLPRPGGAVATPANARYEPEPGLVGHSVRQGRDCGEESRWAWDGTRFRLMSWTAMPLCRGVAEVDWLVLHRAEAEEAEPPPPPEPTPPRRNQGQRPRRN